MLSGDLYQLRDLSNVDKTISAYITLNPEHIIFEGHYPGRPVLPGACMLQILKEVLEMVLSARVLMVKATQLKFLAMVDPQINTELKIDIGYKLIEDQILVKASLISKETAVFKFTGNFKRL